LFPIESLKPAPQFRNLHQTDTFRSPCCAQSHALATIWSISLNRGVHPSSSRILRELATNTGGSPGLLGDSCTLIGLPVTRFADSITSRTLNPLPLPRL